MESNIIKIGIIEDNEILMSNYVDFFSMFDNYMVSFALSSLNKITEKSKRIKYPIPNVILLDLILPGISGLDGISILKSYYPQSTIIILSAYSDLEKIIEAIENGADGYLVKGISIHELKHYIDNYKSLGAAVSPNVASKLFKHINIKHKKQTSILDALTPKEREITGLVTEGHSHKLIGEKLKIQTGTINQHLKSIYIKLNVNSKPELISKILKP